MENSNLVAMKRFIPLLLTLVVSSCDVAIEGVVAMPDVAPTFHAVIDDSDFTRTYLDENIRLRWTADDRISLFEGTTRNKQYKFLGETGDNAGDFDYVKAGFGTGNDVDRYYAIYPYASTNKLHEDGYITYTFPAEQTYAEGSVGLGANVMVAVTADLDDYDLTFRNAGSYLHVKLYGADQIVGTISVATRGGEAIAGKAYITPAFRGEPTVEMIGTGSAVTLNCGDGVTIGTTKESATPFWVVLPPFTASEGIVVTVNDLYGGSQSFEVASAITFNRNKYKTLTRELTIVSSGAGMGVGGWGDGENIEGGI